MTLAGGPFVSFLLTGLFCICRFGFFRSVPQEDALREILFPASHFLLFFNGFQFFFTLFPMRYRIVCRGFESDGLQMIHILKSECR